MTQTTNRTDIKPGDTITFTTTSHGDRTGTVERITPKTIVVVGEYWKAVIRIDRIAARNVRTNAATVDPVKVDTELATIHTRMTRAYAALKAAFDHAHRMVNDHRTRYGWHRGDDDVESAVRKLTVESESHAWNQWSYFNPAKTIADIEAARAEINQCRADIKPIDDLYNRAPWARFFLVDASDGHIHSSTGCQTCRPTTSFVWLPELSGTTEADAVAAHGPRLCTVCFPSAPLEWTQGLPKPVHYDGTPDPESKPRRVGMHTYRRCTCGSVQIVTMSGALRKHKPGA